MKSPFSPRSLRFESLESRDLLAGNVTVENRNGSLFVIGDDLDNDLSIERVAVVGSTGALTVQLRITPHDTTTINGLPIGQHLDLADFSRDGNLDLRAGSDSITLTGHYFDDVIFSKSNTNLRVSTGSGNDHIEIDSWSWGASIVIAGDWNGDGTDTVGISRVRAGVAGLATGTALSLSDVSATITDSDFTGAISATSKVFAKVEIHNTRASSLSLSDVDGTVTDSDFTGAMSAKGKVFAKVEIHRSSASSLTLTNVDGTVTDTDFTGAIKYAASGKHINKAEIVFLRCTASSVSAIHRGSDFEFSATSCRFFDVVVDGDSGTAAAPLRFVSTATLSDCIVTSTSTSLTLVNVDSSLTDSSFAGAINSKSSGWDIKKMTMSYSSASSAKLSEVECSLTNSDFSGALSATASAKHHYTVKLSNVSASRLSVVKRGGGLDFSSERGAFFDVFVDVDSSLSPPATLFPSSISSIDDDCDGIMTLRSVGQVDVTVDGSSAGDLFMKHYRPTRSDSNSRVSLSDISVTRRLSIEGRGGLDVTAEASAAVDFFLKLDGIKGEARRSSLTISDCPSITHLSLRSTEQVDLDLSRSSFFDVFADISPLNGLPPGEPVLRIKMSDLLVSSLCSVSTRAGTVDAEISDSKFEVASWSFGASNSASLGGSTGLSGGKVSIRDLSVMRSASLSVSGLYDVVVSSFAAVDFFLKFDRATASSEFSSVECIDVDMTGRMSIESTGALDVTLDTCTASDMTIFMKIGSVKGELHRSSVSIEDSSASKRLSLTSLVTCDVSLARSSFFDVFVDVTRSASPPGSPYLQLKMEDLLVSGFCSVSTKGGPVDAEIGDSTFQGACSWSFGASNPTTVGSGSGGGAGKVSVHDISVTKSASLSMSGLYDVVVSSFSAVDFFVKLDRTAVSSQASTIDCDDLKLSGALSLQSKGAVTSSFSLCYTVNSSIWIESIKGETLRSSVSISDSSVSSRLSLVSRVTCDVSCVRSSFFDVAVDVTRSASPPNSEYMKIELEELLVSGFCTVTATGGADAEVGDSTFEKSLSFSWGLSQTGTFGAGGGGGAGKVSMSDLSVMTSLSVSSRGQTAVTALACSARDIFIKVDRLSRLDNNSSVDLGACSTSNQLSIEGRGGVDMSVHGGEFSKVFMKVESVKGEVHRQSVSLDDISGGALRIVSGEPQDFSLTRAAFFDVFYDLSVASTSPQGAILASTCLLEDLTVDGSLSVSGRGISQELTLTRVSSSTASVQLDSPSGRSSHTTITDGSFSQRLSVVTKGENHITVDSCSSFDTYLKFERLTTGQPGASSVVLSSLTLGGALTVDSRGSLDVDLSASRAVDMFLKIEGVRGERRTSSIELAECVADNRLSLTSSSAVDLTYTYCAANDMLIRVDSVSGSPVDGSRVRVTSTDCNDGFSLSTSGGADVVTLDDVTTHGRATVSLGGGDDQLEVLACDFDEVSLFDGGGGFDKLTVDAVFATTNRITSWDLKTNK